MNPEGLPHPPGSADPPKHFLILWKWRDCLTLRVRRILRSIFSFCENGGIASPSGFGGSSESFSHSVKMEELPHPPGSADPPKHFLILWKWRNCLTLRVRRILRSIFSFCENGGIASPSGFGGSSESELQIKAGMAAPSTIQSSLQKEKRAFLFVARFVLTASAFICCEPGGSWMRLCIWLWVNYLSYLSFSRYQIGIKKCEFWRFLEIFETINKFNFFMSIDFKVSKEYLNANFFSQAWQNYPTHLWSCFFLHPWRLTVLLFVPAGDASGQYYCYHPKFRKPVLFY